MTKARFELQSLSKSCNEILILSVLAEGPKHGYQLALEIEERSEGYFRFNHGTLYPILHKLEKDGLIRGAWSEGGPRRKRKSYTLSAKGRRYLEADRDAWDRFFERFKGIVRGAES